MVNIWVHLVNANLRDQSFKWYLKIVHLFTSRGTFAASRYITCRKNDVVKGNLFHSKPPLTNAVRHGFANRKFWPGYRLRDSFWVVSLTLVAGFVVPVANVLRFFHLKSITDTSEVEYDLFSIWRAQPH